MPTLDAKSARSPAARHMTLNMAWNEFMIVRPDLRSTIPPCVFTEMLNMFPVMPSVAMPTHQYGIGARVRKHMATPSAAAMYRLVEMSRLLRLPMRVTSALAKVKLTRLPTGPENRSHPCWASSSPRSSFMSSIDDPHVAQTSPRTAKYAATEIRSLVQDIVISRNPV